MSALALLWSSSSLATDRSGVLCRAGEERAPRTAAHTYDAEDSLRYAQQRWLDPTTGRFLSLDPVAGSLFDPLSTQGFTYVNANPTRFTDPDGRQSMCTSPGPGAAACATAMAEIEGTATAGGATAAELAELQAAHALAPLGEAIEATAAMEQAAFLQTIENTAAMATRPLWQRALALATGGLFVGGSVAPPPGKPSHAGPTPPTSIGNPVVDS